MLVRFFRTNIDDETLRAASGVRSTSDLSENQIRIAKMLSRIPAAFEPAPITLQSHNSKTLSFWEEQELIRNALENLKRMQKESQELEKNDPYKNCKCTIL